MGAVVVGGLAAVLVLAAYLTQPPPKGANATSPLPSGSARPVAFEYHVAPDGSDRATGSASEPWASLSFALEQLRPGDTLLVHGGTYREDLNPRIVAGTPNARITVRGAAGERPVVKGLVRLQDPDHWTIENLGFSWGGGDFDDHMVKVSSGTGWVLDGIRVHGSKSRAGLLIAASSEDGSPQDYTLRNSVVSDSQRGANLYLNPGLDSRGGLIEHNIFTGSPTENLKVGYGGDCGDQSDPLNGAADITVRNNTLFDGGQPLTVAEPADRITVTGNIIGRGRRGMLLRLDGQCGNLGSDITVWNNLGYDADRWCEEFDSPLRCREVDGGGNLFPHDPRFDTEEVNGFQPQDPIAAQFGRFAP